LEPMNIPNSQRIASFMLPPSLTQQPMDTQRTQDSIILTYG
jgi:hypothetical protein